MQKSSDNQQLLDETLPDRIPSQNVVVESSPKGRFCRFEEALGFGAYKSVYRGIDNDTGCEIAWNTVSLASLPLREQKRISSEIQLLKKLNHKHIVKLISAWINRDKQEVIFITDFITGGSLKSYLRRIKHPRLKVIKKWCREILTGLEYLHTQDPNPIIHRDIKTENVFINSNEGEIRIGDLGLATVLSDDFSSSILGTPEYMAPEIFEGKYNTAVDIYALGMTILELVTLETPYHEYKKNPVKIYKKLCQGVKPKNLNSIADKSFKKFVMKFLLPIEKRPSATELLQDEFLNSIDEEFDNLPVKLHSKRKTRKSKRDSNLDKDHKSVKSSFKKKNNKLIMFVDCLIDYKLADDSIIIKLQVGDSKNNFEFLLSDFKEKSTDKLSLKILNEAKINNDYFGFIFVKMKKIKEEITTLFESVNNNSPEQRRKSNRNKWREQEQTIRKSSNFSLKEESNQRLINTVKEEDIFNTSKVFLECYEGGYVNSLNQNYMENETLNMMKIRHQIELNELKKIHVKQKQDLILKLKKSEQNLSKVYSPRKLPLLEKLHSQEQLGLNLRKVSEKIEEYLSTDSREMRQRQRVAKNPSSFKDLSRLVPKSTGHLPYRSQKPVKRKVIYLPPKDTDSSIRSPVSTQTVKMPRSHNHEDATMNLKRSKKFSIEFQDGIEADGFKIELIDENPVGKDVTIRVGSHDGEGFRSEKISSSGNLETIPAINLDRYLGNEDLVFEKVEVLRLLKLADLGVEGYTRQQLAQLITTEFIDKELNKESSYNPADVKKLQVLLSLYFPNSKIVPRGNFGNFTEFYLKQAQKELRIPEDGVVNKFVWDKIRTKILRRLKKIKNENMILYRSLIEQENIQKMKKQSNTQAKISLKKLENEFFEGISNTSQD